MKLFISCLVMCALLGISQAQYQDSPAVKAAKAAHFEAVRRAETIIANNPGPFNQTRRPVEETTQHKLGLNVHDTPEVAAAKSAHYKALRDAEEATAIANSTSKYPDSFSGVHHQHQQHHVPAVYSPPATPSPTRRPATVQYQPTPVHHHQSVPIVQQTTQHKLGVNVHETPEVAAARAAHFEALRRAEQAASVSGPIEYEDTYLMVPSYQKIAPIVPVPIAQPAVRGGPRFIEPSVPHYGQRAHAVMYVPQTYEQNVEYGQHIEMIPVVTYPQTNQHKLGVNVEDTPEVAAAKKAHFEAFRQAQIAAGSAAFEDEEENSAPRNNYFSNPTRQYGQVNY
ncbi:pupal cuticle protein-like [Episyrphus balteatus]|uniref:pupal cuticle protein-like n=1 Tax=Episyrphus balteatus TaxID=286459 RepID=UPI0024860D9B|nr:pupal cuticle protein-like [Episyrphus balteatus]